MLFSFRDWYMNNAQRSKEITYGLFFSGNFRLTLLFFASGYLARYLAQKMPLKDYVAKHLRFSAAAVLTGVLLINPAQIALENAAQPGRIPVALALYPQGLLSLHHLWFIVYLWGCILVLYAFCRFAGSTVRMMNRYPLAFMAISLLLIATIQSVRGFVATDARDTLGSWYSFAVYFAHFTCGVAVCSSRLDRAFSLPVVAALLATAIVLHVVYGYLRLFSVYHDAGWLPVLSQGSKAVTNMALLFLFMRLAARQPKPIGWLNSARRQIWFIYLWHQPLILLWGLMALPLAYPIAVKFAAVVALSTASLYLLWRTAMLLPPRLRPFMACK